jgi:hypothetical protein
MKTILFLLSILSFSFANQYTFLLDKYDKETELEAKIILNIATASMGNEIKLFIPKMTNVEKDIYSKMFTLVNKCSDANFVFVKNNNDIDFLCKSPIEGKLFFTNNYKKLVNNTKYIGAFFWNKSRPNIIFIKNRLVERNIKLTAEYEKFIEDIK